MRLETEFRLCLQRQTLEQSWRAAPADHPPQTFAPSSSAIVGPSPLAIFEPSPSAIVPSTWVKLLQPPSAHSSDEALLLCQAATNQWIAWIPDYGEIVLGREQFELLFGEE